MRPEPHLTGADTLSCTYDRYGEDHVPFSATKVENEDETEKQTICAGFHVIVCFCNISTLTGLHDPRNRRIFSVAYSKATVFRRSGLDVPVLLSLGL